MFVRRSNFAGPELAVEHTYIIVRNLRSDAFEYFIQFSNRAQSEFEKLFPATGRNTIYALSRSGKFIITGNMTTPSPAPGPAERHCGPSLDVIRFAFPPIKPSELFN